MTAPWEGQEDQNLAQTLKKAKRKSLFRSIVISLIVSILTLTAIFFGAAQLVERRSTESRHSEWMYMRISSPNEFSSGFRDNRGFLSGVMEVNTYKIIEGVPVPWNEKWFNYNEWWFPFATGAYGGTTHLSGTDPQMKVGGYEYNRQYNPYNGQREMAYYIPQVEYGKILNDLPLLTKMEPDELMEMALSFDKPYSFDEVKKMLPEGARPVWYWVDTYDETSWFNLEPYEDGNGGMIDPEPMASSSGVYGFGIGPKRDEASPDDFLEHIKNGLKLKDNYQSEYKRIQQYLKKDKNEPEAGDVRILGVVVTGSAAGLKNLNGQPYIRGAVLGAVADNY
ncbi:anti-sigma factor [Paenibacillus sp. IHBB 3054]|uniref:anti-sigma factor n=1 Tax=Paenibacillus sp. IHBB 3054 TaxID=3425689 RepID=UPI003F673669